jgi:hypothetical protein
MIRVTHPAVLFALARADGAHLVGFLLNFAVCVELAAFCSLLAPVAEETLALADDMYHRWHLPTQVDAHDGLARGRCRFWQGVHYLSHPLAPRAFHT